ncbi:MAG: AAA-type ATPase lid domain-containing protein [Methylobacter sp.]
MDYHWPGNIRELEHLLSRTELKSATQENRQADFITIFQAYLGIVPEQAESLDYLHSMVLGNFHRLLKRLAVKTET